MSKAEEILKEMPSVKMGLDDFYGRQTVLNAINKALNMHFVMPMFADESNEGNEKRAELIRDYNDKIQNWTGTYSQGFADCFNWLCRAFKAN